jgi:putative transposase
MLNRKTNRLKGYDYSKGGAYFVTICVNNRTEYFGKIVNEKIVLNKFGEIVEKQWLWLSEQYDYVILDEYKVMPNHFHGIIIVVESFNRNGRDRSLQKNKSISSLVGAFKTTSSKQINLIDNTNFKWQKSFNDRVIRNEREFGNIQAYIRYNDMKWQWDIENKANINKDTEKYFSNIVQGIS